MEFELPYGKVNARIIGMLMKEWVRRAIIVIRNQRFTFEATAKMGYGGELDDIVTTADKAAQKIYVEGLRECFPDFGIVAEEEGLKIACRIPGVNMFFTVDPLDGTKAMSRRQSHGIGTMISLVANGTVIAAYVGDVMTQEVFGFNPESPTVHRISEFEHPEPLSINRDLCLAQQYVLLRNHPHVHCELFQRLISLPGEGGLFKGIGVTDGSIGTSMARLWKSEVGAAVLNPAYNTPWDLCPILGNSKRLGFVFLKPVGEDRLSVFEPPAITEIQHIPHDTLVVHESRLTELAPFMA